MKGIPRKSLALLVLTSTLALWVGGCQRGEARRAPSLETLHLLVEGYAHAIESNNRELALWYLHPRSPQRSELDAALREQLAQYQERARIANLERVSLSDGAIVAKVDQDIIRIFGLKLTRGARRSNYEFRALGSSWRIWAIDELEPPGAPLSCCT